MRHPSDSQSTTGPDGTALLRPAPRTALGSLAARRRAERLQRECEALRPLGEDFLMRRFAGRLTPTDAEEAVADVLARLHRHIAEGRPPRNLRAVFFTGVRNAAIDQLRSRAARPTVSLEAAAATPAGGPSPLERAEGRDDAARLQEALARLRPNYRRAILLRFGLGLTVPEISQRLGISLPAAKKLVVRASRHVAQRLTSIEGEEFCPEMRELARRSLFEKQASGLADESEAEVLRAHFAHCGSCRSFLNALRDRLHDLGAAAALGLLSQGASEDRVGPLARLGDPLAPALDALQSGLGRLRDLGHRLSGLQPADSGAAGALAGAGQKLAAVCTAGAATASCVLGGAVGPGIGADAIDQSPRDRPRAERDAATLPTPASVAAPPPAPTIVADSDRPARRRAATRERPHLSPPPSEPLPGEFGFEGASPPGPETASGGEATTLSTATASPGASPAAESSTPTSPPPAAPPSGGLGFQG